MRIPETREERIGCGLAAAVIAAPFLALLYGPDAGLAVTLVALLATSWLGWDAARRAEPEAARRIRLAVAVNLVLAAAALALLVARLW